MSAILCATGTLMLLLDSNMMLLLTVERVTLQLGSVLRLA